jgi:hypothetical protein
MKRRAAGVVAAAPYHVGMLIFIAVLRMRTKRSLTRSNMIGYYSAKSIGVLYQSISQPRKALFCLHRGLQSLYCGKDEICNLLILYITNAIALVSVYSSYLPTPVKVAWILLSSYYRCTFVVVDDASHKSQASFS